MTEQLTLTFESKRLDYIYNVLAQRPFAEVQDIIFDIRRQVAIQQNPNHLVPVQDTPSHVPDIPKGEAA